MSSFVLIGSLIYPFVIYDLFDYITKLQPSSATQFNEYRSELFTYMTITELGFVGLVFIIAIFLSHKVAGPMYKLKLFMRNIRETGEIKTLAFRKHDYFKEVADEFNQTIDFLVNKTEEEHKYLTEIADYIENIALVVPEDKKPVLEEMRSKIQAMQNYHQE